MSSASARYAMANLPGDMFAGLTLWAVSAAQALAYSRLAHATPIAGLVTAICGALAYALLGSSRRISIGPAGGICAMVGAAVLSVPQASLGEYIAALTLMAAVVLFVAGALRITFLQRLFPAPVFVGYLAGTGISILIGQATELLTHGTFALGVGLAAIAGVLALKWLLPRVPAPFVVLFIATAASMLFDFAGKGVPVIGSALGQFGEFVSPLSIGKDAYAAMWAPALGLALFVYVDGLANAEALAKEGDPPIRARREYFALGGVNLLSGLWGGFVAGCSTSRSVVGMRAGANTRLAPIVAGLLLLLTAFSVVTLIEPMPLAALAGVVFVAAFDLINVAKLREFARLRREDFWIALIAIAGVLFTSPMTGVGIGVGAALAEALRRGMQPQRSLLSGRSPDRYYEAFDPARLPLVDGTVIYRFGAPLFFANADVFVQDMRAIADAAPRGLHAVMVNADSLGIPDAAARDALTKAQQMLARRGIDLLFGNARHAAREALQEAGFKLVDEKTFVDLVMKIREDLKPAAPPTTTGASDAS
ncbi:MAG TPA: SulP family inorganic anion transporter [Casimicrobiaceae bacterium]|nr:SulP family inorganic anion transporter [Casimicrobiaceae bacterium]